MKRPVAALRARVCIRRGDLEAAVAWVRGHGVSAEGPPSFLREFEQITLARLLIASARAESSMAPAREALELAEPEGYVSLFADEGAPLVELLRMAERRNIAPAYTRRLLVTHKPDTMSYAEAAAVPYGALMAMTLLRKVALGPGRRVLIIGASGGIGAAAVQLARHAGAEVTGVCGPQRVAFVRELGADHVLDYTRDALSAGGGAYDVIIDILGRSSFAACRELLTPDGCYLRVSFKLRELLQMAWTSLRGGRRVICALSNETPADLEAIRRLAETGVIRSVIDRRYPLEQTAEAHRYLESGARRGPVVVEPA